MRMNMYDTPGNREYDMIIRGAISNFDHFILCYDPNDEQSLIDLE